MKRAWWIPVAALVASVALGGCTDVVNPPIEHPHAARASSSTFTRGLTACGLGTGDPGVVLDRRKAGVALDSEQGSRPSGIDYADVECVLGALGMPSSGHELLKSSSVFGGLQTVSWKGLTATWTFRDTAHMHVRIVETPVAQD